VPAPQAAAALNHLAHSGQMIADLPHGVYRWRQIMSQALGEAEIGPENPESAGAREILARKRAIIESKVKAPSGGTIYTGKAESKCSTSPIAVRRPQINLFKPRFAP